MLTESQIDQIVAATASFREKAEKIYGIKLAPITIGFDLRGVCGGKAHCGEWKIRYSPVLAAQNMDDFLVNTVGHEVAHLVAYFLHGRKAVNHGPYWQDVMVKLGLEPSIYHDYDVTDVKINMKRFIYACPECDKRYRITKVKHDKIQRRKSFYCYCRDCGKDARLAFDHEIPAKGQKTNKKAMQMASLLRKMM